MFCLFLDNRFLFVFNRAHSPLKQTEAKYSYINSPWNRDYGKMKLDKGYRMQETKCIKKVKKIPYF
jgi:hypothetical protein